MSIFKQRNKKPKPSAQNTPKESQPLYSSIESNVHFLQETFCNTDDLHVQDVSFHEQKGKLLYFNTLSDTKEIHQLIFIPLVNAEKNKSLEDIFQSSKFAVIDCKQDAVTAILTGKCVLFFPNSTVAYAFNTIQEHTRSIKEPDNEKMVRGSHQGFVENLDINMNLLRQRIKNPKLTIKMFALGNVTKTNVVIIYVDGIANPTVIEEVTRRITSISTDMIFSPGYIEECIEDYPFSPFQQILFTERPDRTEANLMEGRVAIISEGGSEAMIVPVTFFSFFQTPDDYNIRYFSGSMFRLLRLFSFWGALLLPSIYIAIVAFHFELIPHDLVTLVKGSIESIPLPPFAEALFMLTTVELIREAGIRLPSPIGQTIGIVGGLIIGDAVVNAGVVSNIMVIVIALTAIMSFTLSSYEMGNTVRLLSLPIMIAAATLGFVGIIFALMIIVIHMCKIESFGTPYISPLAPLHFRELKDAVIRAPIWVLNRRPKNAQAIRVFAQGPSREWQRDEP